jgi:hypothetical protein
MLNFNSCFIYLVDITVKFAGNTTLHTYTVDMYFYSEKVSSVHVLIHDSCIGGDFISLVRICNTYCSEFCRK